MAIITKQLSDFEIKKARFTTTEAFEKQKKTNPNAKLNNKLSDGQGLYLIIKPNNNKMWQFDFRYGGKRKSMSFGSYPLISLKEARRKRTDAKKLLEENINPITDKKAQKVSECLTLESVIEEWLDIRKKSFSDITIISNRRTFKNIINPLGSYALKDIKRIDIITVLQKMQKRGVIETAHRLLSLLNKIYMFSVTKEYIELE